jgi:hypothetical protein
VWTLLGRRKAFQESSEELDDVLACLLKVMVLLDEAPAEFIHKLSPRLRGVANRGNKLRSRLPAYLEQQRTLLADHWTLPAVLHPLVAAYAEPTHEDIWTLGLRVWVIGCSNPGCGGAGLKKCTGCKQARYCAQACQKAHRSVHKAECKLWVPVLDTAAASTVTRQTPVRDASTAKEWDGWAVPKVVIPVLILGALVARRFRML